MRCTQNPTIYCDIQAFFKKRATFFALFEFITWHYGKELMTQDELAVMDGGKCIFMLRGVRPFLSDKYDLTKHPNYKYTADADKKYLFDMERYMKRKPAIVKPDEPFEMYELTAMDLQ